MERTKKKLPGKWIYSTLGESTDIEMGQSPPGSETNSKGIGVPLIGGASDFHNGSPKANKYTTAPTKICKKGDLILCIRATIGKAAFAESEFCLGRGVAGIRISHLEPRWVMHFLTASENLLSSLGTGTTFKQIDKKKLTTFPLPIPPLCEQQRIIAKIEELQERSRRAREALEPVPELLAQLRQSILGAAFRGDLTRKWREQNPDVEPATELVKRIRTERRKRWEAAELEKLKAKGLTGKKLDAQFAKQREKYKEPEPVDTRLLPVLPKGWVWVSAECLVPVDEPIVYGIILPGPHVDDGIPYIRPLEIQNDVIVNDPIPKTSPEIAAKYRRAVLSTGDIILSIVGTIGKVAIVPERLNGANITQSSARLKPWVDFVSSEYLAEVLRSPLLRKQYEKMRFGNAVQRLNIAHVRSLAIPLPPKTEQKEIIKNIQRRASLSESFFSSIETCLEKLDALESSVLYKAFRGELIPQDPNDEPASILLERIRQEKARQADGKKAKPKRRGRKTTKRRNNGQKEKTR